MTVKEIKDLLKLISDLDLKEVRIKNQDLELKVRTGKDTGTQIINNAGGAQARAVQYYAPPASAPVAAPALPAGGSQDTASEEEGHNYIEIKSPMVGTFYRSASPDKPAYVQVGDTISQGSVVCIIEAMKLFNEIESEVSGKIVKVMVDDSSPVEYDQVLFLVEA